MDKLELNAAFVKKRARELGADLVGIASAATLNAFPPDPRWPQTPERISPYCKSVIVLAQRIPAGAFRCKSNVPVQYIDMLVLRKMDKVAYRLAEELEDAGHPSFVTAAQETDWNLKRASYGRLSTRHLGVEAGLGTLGLEVNILTPEFGPRVYLTGILTELELEPDRPLTEQVCIGESCSRCLHACPVDAVLHFGIDKRACATEAQEFGFSTILQFFERFIDQPLAEKEKLGALARRLRLLARACCASSARSAIVRAASPSARSATTIMPISPTCRKRSRKRRRRKSRSANAIATNRAAEAPTFPASTTGTGAGSGRTAIKGMVARQLQEFKKLQQERKQAALATADENGRE